MITELARITKKGGYLLLTVPFLGGLHEEPNDYQRFTKYGLTVLLKKHGYKTILIKSEGSLFSTQAMLFNEYWISKALKGEKKIKRSVYFIFYPLFILTSYVAFIMDRIIKTDKLPFNYLVLAKKI